MTNNQARSRPAPAGAATLTAALAATLAAVAPVQAQTPLEIEYEETQQRLNAEIVKAAGAVAATALPDAAFFNPLRISVDIPAAAGAGAPLEIKAAPRDNDRGAGAESGALAGQEAPFLPNEARTQTLAMGVLQTDNPLHWAFHGDRLYLTPTPKDPMSLREKRTQSQSADARYLSQADAFRQNINFSAVRAER